MPVDDFRVQNRRPSPSMELSLTDVRFEKGMISGAIGKIELLICIASKWVATRVQILEDCARRAAALLG